MHFFGRTPDTIWTLIAAPAIWAGHFLASYVAAAYVCAPNADIFRGIGGVRVFIGGATVISLVLIALFFYRAWRDWRRRTTGGDRGTRQDQEGFLEFATMLLASLSFLGVLLDATPALLIADCR
ncbi:hypothetical protein [Citreimonas salinaria]|uniref:Uncharacterized protein n=1 Tax=Citreimonas salinaria TaxID=321339 RepID=A0A1H3NUY5_9RHOB|nr:hypothetical protein [Citreimonas salinaria]SDY92756.1 hypothetical protein SAMN05444340_1334 [Citreimonas salinaria]